MLQRALLCLATLKLDAKNCSIVQCPAAICNQLWSSMCLSHSAPESLVIHLATLELDVKMFRSYSFLLPLQPTLKLHVPSYGAESCLNLATLELHAKMLKLRSSVVDLQPALLSNQMRFKLLLSQIFSWKANGRETDETQKEELLPFCVFFIYQEN